MRYIAAIVAYLIAASLAGGYYYNHRCDEYAFSRNVCGGQAIQVAFAWPVYWLGRFGIEVTK